MPRMLTPGAARLSPLSSAPAAGRRRLGYATRAAAARAGSTGCYPARVAGRAGAGRGQRQGTSQEANGRESQKRCCSSNRATCDDPHDAKTVMIRTTQRLLRRTSLFCFPNLFTEYLATCDRHTHTPPRNAFKYLPDGSLLDKNSTHRECNVCVFFNKTYVSRCIVPLIGTF